MRRALWTILAVLFVAIGVPSSHADSYTPVFTCGPCTSALPTAPDVSFAAPSTIDITWENTLFVFSLTSFDPEIVVTWEGSTPFLAQSGTASFTLFLFNDDSPFVYQVDSGGNCLNCNVHDSGTLSFASADAPSTPEPSSVVLMLGAIGFLLLVMPKRLAQGHRQAI
jgi:hypothetical protein